MDAEASCVVALFSHDIELAKVVEEISCGKNINSREIGAASWIIVVAMDSEHRESDVVIWVLVVDAPVSRIVSLLR